MQVDVKGFSVWIKKLHGKVVDFYVLTVLTQKPNLLQKKNINLLLTSVASDQQETILDTIENVLLQRLMT